jgi:hypothetical protein
MARQKKFTTVQSKEKPIEIKTEICMTQTVELENLQQEIDKARVELEQTKLELEEKRKAANAINPRREHDDDELRAKDRSIVANSAKAAAKEEIEKQKLFDNVKITGKFINRRVPGQKVKLTYMKYEDDPVKWYELEDGKVYTLPRGFVDQINEYYYTPHFVQKQGEQNLTDSTGDNSAIHHVDNSNKKYAFIPLNF